MKKTTAKKKTRKRVIKLPQYQGDLRVLIIEPDAKSISEVFGVTSERTKELYDLSEKSMKTHTRISLAIAEVSAHCKHPNELAVALGALFFLRDHMDNPMALLMAALMQGRQTP